MKKLLAICAGFLLLGACVSQSNQEYNKTKLETEVKYALTLLEGGDVGCGDAVFVFSIKKVGDLTEAQKIKSGLEEIFTIKDHEINDYYNALYQSDLEVSSIQVNNINNKKIISVDLKGEINSGRVCDDSRIQEQINQTIKSNLTPTQTQKSEEEITVTLDDKPLSEYFSLK